MTYETGCLIHYTCIILISGQGKYLIHIASTKEYKNCKTTLINIQRNICKCRKIMMNVHEIDRKKCI